MHCNALSYSDTHLLVMPLAGNTPLDWQQGG